MNKIKSIIVALLFIMTLSLNSFAKNYSVPVVLTVEPAILKVSIKNYENITEIINESNGPIYITYIYNNEVIEFGKLNGKSSIKVNYNKNFTYIFDWYTNNERR